MKCLFCFNAINNEPILLEDRLEENSDETVADLIRAYFPISDKIIENANNDGVCNTCWEHLQNFHEFYVSVYMNYENEFIEECENLIETNEMIVYDEEIINERDPEDEVLISAEQQIKKESHFTDDDSMTQWIAEIVPEQEEIKRTSSMKNASHATADDEIRILETANMFCELCQFPFNSLSQAKNHFKQMHNTEGYIVCCNRRFKQKCRLVEHVNTHYNFTYPCSKCEKTFDSKAYLSKHMACHETIKQYKCDQCPKAFAKKFQVRNHLLSVHIFDNVKPELECPIENCHKKFVNHARLKHHVDYTHSLNHLEICEICSKTFKSKGTADEHRKTHLRKPEDRIKCEICGHYLGDIKSYNRHVKNHATESQENCCKYCGKRSPNLNALKKHIRYVHEMPKNYNCKYCQKSFKRARNLIDHEASVHTLQDLYTCSFCPKTFRNQSNMLSHRKKQHPDLYQKPSYMRDQI